MTFKEEFKTLYDKALNHFVGKEWSEDMDKNVKVVVTVLNANRIRFELIQTMIGQQLKIEELTWDEIINLND